MTNKVEEWHIGDQALCLPSDTYPRFGVVSEIGDGILTIDLVPGPGVWAWATYCFHRPAILRQAADRIEALEAVVRAAIALDECRYLDREEREVDLRHAITSWRSFIDEQ